MTFGVPWNVKGIRPEVRLTAKEAARRSGLSLGEWLNSVIIESALDEGVRPQHRSHVEDDDSEDLRPQHRGDGDDDKSSAVDQTLASLNESFDGLNRQLERLVRINAGLAASARTIKDEENSRRLVDALDRLDRRLDRLIAEGRNEIARRANAVDRAVAALDREPFPDSGELGLERAVAEITARQRALDAGPAAPSGFDPSHANGTLEQQLQQINIQLEMLRHPCGVDAAISELRNDLAEIRRTLTEAMPRHALAALEGEVRSLAERLLKSRQSGADEAALASIEKRIAELRDAVSTLAPAESLVGVSDAVQSLARKIEAIAAADQNPATLRQLDEAIASLRGVASQVASNDVLAAIAEDVRGLAAKIDNIVVGGDVLSTLDQRIAVLADALERHNATAVPPQFESVLRNVNDRLERLQVKSGENSSLGAIEHRIAMLMEKLDAGRPPNESVEPIVDALKEKIAEIRLTQSANDGRIQDTLEAVHSKLGHVVDRLATMEADLRTGTDQRTQDALETVHGTLGQMADRLALIEADLRTGTERRTQDVLEAIRATLGQMSDRLAVIETDLRAASQAKGAPAVSSATAPERRSVPPIATTAPTQAAVALKLPMAPPSREPIDPNLPPDHPLEPGSRGRAAVPPGDRITDTPSVKPPVIPDPGGKSNFIAAARRAAQAAAATPRTVPEAGGTDAAPSPTISTRMRALLVGVGIIIVLMGILHVGLNLFGLLDGPVPESRVPAMFDGIGTLPSPAPDSATDEPVAPVRDRQSRFGPSGEMLTAAPAVGAIIPDMAGRPHDTSGTKPEITGSVVRLPVVPAATPEYAALPEPPGHEKLPAAIGGPVLRAAALKGDAAAAYEVALRYAEGRGVPQNYEEAARWLERAVKENLAPAQFRLGSLHEKGLGVKKDLQIARQLYTAAAEKGHAKAMHNLAVLYAEGLEGKPDYGNAAQWFRKAADYGIVDSQYNLGILYARGIGVEQNLAESYKWFTLAAQNGDQGAIKKRDEIGTRLDAQSLMAARLAAQTWTADPQPEEATTIKPPAGGWDQAIAGARPTKSKSTARPKAGSATGLP